MSDLNVPVLECRALAKTYQDGKLFVDVFRCINLAIAAKEQVAIIGPSGSGKSTLLHLLGGLDKPTEGTVCINGTDIYALSEKKRSQLRNRTLGFVYQLHHLLPEFSVLENVCLPLLLQEKTIIEAEHQATELLAKVGLAKRLGHKVSELSGGERQRTAIARALVTKPSCLLADEPTGNLDQQTANGVYETMLELNRDVGTSLVIVTHDLQLAKKMDRILTIQDGEVFH